MDFIKMKNPYTYWTREELYINLERQALAYKYNLDEVKLAVFSNDWEPTEDFNGCNFVQDDKHPFLPCFIHDYDWIVNGGGNDVDLKFKRNLELFGYSKTKATIYYIAVRIGWLFYYQFTK